VGVRGGGGGGGEGGGGGGRGGREEGKGLEGGGVFELTFCWSFYSYTSNVW